MSPLAQRPYSKMNGIGNRIVVLDLRDVAHAVTAAEARAVAAHEPYDQMMVLERARRPGTDAFMRIYNGDGSEAGACGNGTRCVAWHLMPRLGRDRLTLQTPTSLVRTVRLGSQFTVDMGAPGLGWEEIPLAEPFADTRAIELQIGPIDAPVLHTPSAVSMGNPHAVFWVDRDPQSYDLARFGPMLEHHPIFPERANISLAQVVDRSHILLNTWERGAGLTLACGSAACAVAVAGVRLGRVERAVLVSQRGGDLQIEWREADGHVLMTGPVAFEHEGILDARWFADAA